MRLLSKIALSGALGLIGCAKAHAPTVTAPTAASSSTAAAPVLPPRLVVLVVIDQLPSWSFEPAEPLLTAGLGRLLREGAYWPRAQYDYAATLTAPGHATLGTGAPPSATGIVANDWWDRQTATYHTSVADPKDGPSPWRLRVDGVGDVLQRETQGRAHVVGVSLKDRAAILPVGRHPDLAVWYDPGAVAFTTSAYYAPTLADRPPWLDELGRAHPIAPRLDYVWQPLDAAVLAREAGQDLGPGEPTSHPLGATFPHRLAAAPEPARALVETPLADELTLEAALAALDGEQLGQDEVPDLLTISFSAHDYAGHLFGPESWEALDVLLRLDRLVGQLLAALDARVGVGRYAVVLTSDHGVTRMPERSIAAGRYAVRVDPVVVEATAERAATNVAGAGDWIAATRDPTIYLSPSALALPASRRDALLDAVVDAIAQLDGVGYVVRTDRIAGDCDARAESQAIQCRALFPGESGEILYGARPDSIVINKDRDPATHGSSNLDDRLVPVIVYAPGIAAARHPESVSTRRVAPTLSKLLGIPAPPAATLPSLLP